MSLAHRVADPRSRRRSAPAGSATAGTWTAPALLGLLLLTSGCTLIGGGPEASDDEARTVFEDLIARGRPADSDVAFDELDGDAFDRARRRYGDEQDTAAPAEPPADTLDAFADLVEAAGETSELAEPPLNPYLEFGQNIIWYPLREGETERLIMKPYTFPKDSGQKIFDLLRTYGNFTIHAAVTNGTFEDVGPQPVGTVLLDLRPGFSVEAYSDPRQGNLTSPSSVALSDMLFVTATAGDLMEVEHFIDLFAADVRQIEIEAKIVEVTTREALDLGVRPINDSTPIFGLPNPGTFVNGIGYNFPNGVDATEALFGLGAVFDGVTFNAVLEAVASFENVSIISRPKVAVREGARADIVNVTRIPFYEVQNINAAGVPQTRLNYTDVGVQMYVIPRVIGRDTVILNIDIEASQSTGSSVSFVNGGITISVPEIAKRNARTIVRLEPGQAVILGGLISERTVDRETKVPLVGDIPILGQLFKSNTKSKEQTNVLFFIRPRILEGSDLNSPFE